MNLKSFTLGLSILFIFTFSACGGAIKRAKIFNSSAQFSKYPSTIHFDNTNLEEINVAMVGLGYDGNQIAQSMYQANMNASMQANYHPAAGLAGALIGGSIAQSTAHSAAQNRKNEPVSLFLEKLSSIEWNKIIDNMPSQVSKWQVKSKITEYDYYIEVSPELNLSADYRALELVTLVQVKKANKKKKDSIFYRNYFHIHSSPLLKTNSTVTQLNDMDFKEIESHLTSLAIQLDLLIFKELTDWRINNRQQNNQPIRFRNDNKQYYERGTIIQRNEGKITYRTLRGEIKMIPVDV